MTSDAGEFLPDSVDSQQGDEALERVLATVQTLAVELHPGRTLGDLNLDSRLDDVMGFDSLSFLELRDRLETVFAMAIPDEVFDGGLTPRDWLTAIATQLAERADDNVLNPQSDGMVQKSEPLAIRQEPNVSVTDVEDRARSDPGQVVGRYKRAAGRVYGLYAFVVALVIAGACWPAMVILPVSQRLRWRVLRLAGTLLRLLVGISLTVSGEVPENQTVLVVANHASVVDGLVIILAVRRPLNFLAGSVFARQHLVGSFLSGLGCVFVESSSAANAVALTERFTSMLRDGQSIASFPEGGLERTPQLGTFHLGAFRAALDAGVPIIPIGISGTRSIVVPGERRPRRGAIRVKIGTPIGADGADWRSLIALRDLAFSAVAALSDTRR